MLKRRMTMEVTLNIDGKEIKATISAEEWKKIQSQPKKTGYERRQCGDKIFYSDRAGFLETLCERDGSTDYGLYSVANYYSDMTVAENNTRADTLMRKLRRFAAEHGGCIAGKDLDENHDYWVISWNHYLKEITTTLICRYFCHGSICFNCREAAESAIEEFKDELMWYFTEYSPMPEGYWDD